jgi:hypothetical protein
MRGQRAMSDNWQQLGLGFMFALGSIVIIWWRRDVADIIYRWCHSRPALSWGPDWSWWRARPSMSQALFMTWLFAALLLALAVVLFTLGIVGTYT